MIDSSHKTLLDISDLNQLLRASLPERKVKRIQLLVGGLINSNFRVDFDDGSQVVLRIYRDGSDACRKELALHKLIKTQVPVADILSAAPQGVDGSPAFSILEYVDGVTFQELKRSNDHEAIAEAAYSAGKTLAAIGQFEFSQPGKLLVNESATQLNVGERFVEGSNPIPILLDRFVGSTILQKRIGVDLVRQIDQFGWSWAERLPTLEDTSKLVHCDFGNRNILVRKVEGKWRVVAVLDWELAISGSPLLDVGHFLRYEKRATPLRAAFFSRGFLEHGGKLPRNWQQIVRVIDLTALVECLTHEHLPNDVEGEIVDLIKATLEEVKL